MTTYQTQVYRLRQLFSTLAAVTASNPVLLEGEKWNEKDATTGRATGRTKTGDGVVSGTAPNQTITGTAFNDLPFDPSPGGGVTNLSIVNRTDSALTIASSTGDDAELLAATALLAGLQSALDKAKLDSIVVDHATVVRIYVRNNSGVSIPKGAPCYQISSSGTTVTVALADATSEATASQTLGLAETEIPNNSFGYLIAVGPLSGLNTSALAEGQIVWLGETLGALTTTRPTQPAHGVVCGSCVKQGAGTSGILYVKISNGAELSEAHDVLITNPTTGQTLRLGSDGLWRNHTLAAADALNMLFGSPGSLVIMNGATIFGNGGAGILVDVNGATSTGTTPNHGTGPSTGSTSTGACGYFVNPLITALSGSIRGRHTLQSFRRFRFSALIRIPTLSNVTNTFNIFVGGYNIRAGGQVDSVGARISGDTVTATNTDNNVAVSSAMTALVTANTWAKFDISYDGISLLVVVNEGTPLSIDSGWPTQSLGFGVLIYKSVGTADRSVNVALTPTFVGWTALP